MGIEHSPSIVTSDLAFYYDMFNTAKSFIGPPTTNLLQSTDFTTGWSGYCGNTTNVTYNTSDVIAPDGSNTALRHVRGSETGCGQGASWGLLHFLASPMIVGQPYTISVWARTNGPTLSVTLGHNDSTGTGISLTSQWQRFSFTYTPGDTSRGFQFINGNLNTTTYWWRPQCEISSFATTFVNGTRSNTQAIVDLTGNNTITASSLTYDANNSFRFNGSSNFITIPNTQLGNGNVQWTVNAWIRTGTTATNLGEGSVMSNSSGGPVYSMMGINSGRIVYWTYQNNAWSQKLSTGKTVNDNGYHMLTWVNYANNTMDMYVDGVQDFFVANSTSGNNNPVDRIGGSWAAQFVGFIPSVSRYTRALTAEEVNKNFNATRGRYGV